MQGVCHGVVNHHLIVSTAMAGGGSTRRLVLLAGVAVVAAVVGVTKLALCIKRRRLRAKWSKAGKDVVVLHIPPRGNVCPSVSTYSLKLETFLRMANIKHQLDFEEPIGPKNKMPWITVNGEDFADSELIIQKLQVMFNTFPDSNVPREDRAIGLAMRVMLEEHFNWGRLSWRFIEDDMKGLKQVQDQALWMKIPLMVFKRRIKESLYVQGAGRHSIEELHDIMKRDMEALSAYLGDKQFLLGSEPRVVDCSVFGCLCQILYNMPGSPYLVWIQNDFPNLRDYALRMRQRYWPDWNKCLNNPRR